MFEIKRYTPDNAEEWNRFVEESKNGTFLFNRGYMDYHADRFKDFSLMIYRNGMLWALLPANAADKNTLCSHQGLTYGGLVMGNDVTAAAMIEMFGKLNEHIGNAGFRKVVYKAIPWIYHRIPAEEDLYAIFRECGAVLVSREISSSIVIQQQIKWSRDRRYGINKARNNGVTIEKTDRLDEFWKILDTNLVGKYGVKPVHTLEEIQLLKARFPHNIRLYVARHGNDVLGGTLLYITDQVVHSQYISACGEGKRLRVIDAIYDRILNHDFREYRYFDFGKSTEDRGRYLNESLIYQKEGFGARGVCYDTYEWDITQ